MGGAWRSLVARLLWEQEVAGSNPVAPIACGIRVYVKSDVVCWTPKTAPVERQWNSGVFQPAFRTLAPTLANNLSDVSAAARSLESVTLA